MMRVLHGVLLSLLVKALHAHPSNTASSWRGVAIYQLLTDRFAGSNLPCDDLSKYCGGTFNGAQSMAPYVHAMGFNAIWISPIPENSPNGYHGYWATNFSRINPNFGTAGDLKRLVDTYHAKGMKVMVDVVANHVGYVGSADVDPFNDPSHYHNCTGCNAYCNIPQAAFDSHQMDLVEHCRLAGLPDLDQDNPFVRSRLLEWVRQLVGSYGIDGIRIDTVLEVKKDFWAEFIAAAGVFAIGEANDGDPKILSPLHPPFPSLLSFPMYYTLRDVFAYQRPMGMLRDRRAQYFQYFEDPSVLATFVDSHDVPRFLSVQPDLNLYYNALAWVLLAEGIPVVYYGTEGGFNGGGDPLNREPLWQGADHTRHPLFAFLQNVNKFRRILEVWRYRQVDANISDPQCFAFTRGPLLVVLTNVGTTTPVHTCNVPLPSEWSRHLLAGGKEPSHALLGAPLGAPPQPPLPPPVQGQLRVVNGSSTATATLHQGAPAVFLLRPPIATY